MSDILLPLHLLSLAFAGIHVLRADHVGFLWLRGKRDTLDEVLLRKLHRRVWIGLIGLMVTGFFLFYPSRVYLMSESPAFALKMGFVVALFFNSFAIGALSRVASSVRASDLTAQQAVPLIVSGAISGISWLGAIVAAFFLYG